MRRAQMRFRIHLIYIFFEYWAEIYRRGGPKCAFAHTSHMYINIFFEYWAEIYRRGGPKCALAHISHMLTCIKYEYWA